MPLDGPYGDRTIREVIDDYVLVRGDLVDEQARQQLAELVDHRVRSAVLKTLAELMESVDQIEGTKIKVDVDTFDMDVWIHTAAQIKEWLVAFATETPDAFIDDVLKQKVSY